MSLDIRLQMDDTALSPFRDAWQQASPTVTSASAALDLASTARALHAGLGANAVPPYLRAHLGLIPEIAELLCDEDWQLDDAARRGFAGALAYFNDPRDLIPDAHPKFGLLDDAIVIELALSEHRREWTAWQEFAALRRSRGRFGPMDRASWQSLRGDLPRLLGGHAGSYVQSRFRNENGRSRYRLLDDLPRFDMN